MGGRRDVLRESRSEPLVWAAETAIPNADLGPSNFSFWLDDTPSDEDDVQGEGLGRHGTNGSIALT
jgi:hypothetical protein